MNKTKGFLTHLPFDRLLKNGQQFILPDNLSFREKLFSTKRTNVENPNTDLWIYGAVLETGFKKGQKEYFKRKEVLRGIADFREEAT